METMQTNNEAAERAVGCDGVLCRVLDEVEAWYYRYFRGLDTAGWDSASMHFEDWYNEITKAEDRAEVAREALRSTAEYCGAPGNEDVVAECEAFLSRINTEAGVAA